MDGALVIDPSLTEAPFAYMGGRIWLADAPPLSPVAIDGAIIAIAAWSQADGWSTKDYE
jgi:hypothetical protein